MAVAWIGNREVLVGRAAEHAGALLHSSRCPVFSFDTDIHGTRAAIALAERIGAAYDHTDGAAVARETALFTDKGGMTVAPGEARRRADVVVIVGEMPGAHRAVVTGLAETTSRSFLGQQSQFFLIGAGKARAGPFERRANATSLSCGEAGLSATLAALGRDAQGRRVAAAVSNFDRFAKALAAARFSVFLFCGDASDGLALEMLQGLIADLNGESRGHRGCICPASESGWGSTLASTWFTGFPLRTGFARGFPEFDPWRFDVARMIAAGEADFSCGFPPRPPDPGARAAPPSLPWRKQRRGRTPSAVTGKRFEVRDETLRHLRRR